MYQYFNQTNLFELLNKLSFLVLVLFNMSSIKQKRENLGILSVIFCNQKVKRGRNPHLDIFRNPTFCSVIEIILLTFFFYALSSTVFNNKVGDLVNTGRNYFGFAFFGPLVLIALCLILRIKPLRVLDSFSVGLGLALFFVKLGCFCWGCCAGIETEKFGMYNVEYDKVMFPVQLVEAFLGLGIFCFMLFYRKKAKSGTLYSIYLMLFSFTRFFSEFLRMEPPVFLGLKTYQILCIIGFLVGLLSFLLMKKYAERINTYFDEKFKYEIKKKQKIVHAKK